MSEAEHNAIVEAGPKAIVEAEPKHLIWPEKKRLDSAWVHGRVVDKGSYSNVQCIYCSQVISSSITGLKKHLAQIGGSVRPCPRVPKPVAAGFLDNFEQVHPIYAWTLKKRQNDVPLYLDHSHNPIIVNSNGEAAINHGEHSRGRGKAGSLLAKRVAESANAETSKQGFRRTAKRDDDVIGMRTSSTQGAPKDGTVNNASDPKHNSPDHSKMSSQKLFSQISKDSASISRRLEFEGLNRSKETNTDAVKHAEEIFALRNDVLKIKSEVTKLENRWSIICDKLKK